MNYRPHPTKAGHYQIFISQGRKGKKLCFVRECDADEAALIGYQLEAVIKGQQLTIEPTITDTMPQYITYYRTIATPLIVKDMLSCMKRCLLPAFGRLMAKQVGRPMVHQYISDRLETGVTHRTVEKELNYLSAMLKWMHTEGLSTVKMEIPKPPKSKTKPQRKMLPLTLDELSRFLVQLPQDRQALALLMSDAGLRCQEALRIECAAVDLSGRKIVINGKGGKVLVYPILTKRLFDALERQKAGRATGWLVVNPDTGKEPDTEPEPYKSLKTLFRLAAKRAGISKPVTHHVIRHTYSTLLMELGIPAEARQMLLRHSSLATTEHYTHTSPEWLETQANRFSTLIDGLQEVAQEISEKCGKVETAVKRPSYLRLVK